MRSHTFTATHMLIHIWNELTWLYYHSCRTLLHFGRWSFPVPCRSEYEMGWVAGYILSWFLIPVLTRLDIETLLMQRAM